MNNPYSQRLESRPWFEVGRQVEGDEAISLLQKRYHPEVEHHPAYCVYVHVPFCQTICSFCALYTRAVRTGADAVFDEYVEYICSAISNHPCAGALEAPTTVHFGGGTPTHIGFKRLGRIVESLRQAFGDALSCEWALETTTSSISQENLDALHKLGFSRIHLGIQTLNDKIRARVRRSESGDMALEKIQMIQAAGMLVSVDLILGFEDSSESIVLGDLKQLYDAGVPMYSICELRHRSGHHLSDEKIAAQAIRNRLSWQVIWQFFRERKLKPIHIGQFAHSQSDNLYFTHPARDEDCVAIGPYAHGSAGRLYTSNLLLPEYYNAIKNSNTPIAYAVEYGDEVQLIRDLERELLGHKVSNEVLNAVAVAWNEAFPSILSRWHEYGLLDSGGYLTVDGSWFIGNMVLEARSMVTNSNHFKSLKLSKSNRKDSRYCGN